MDDSDNNASKIIIGIVVAVLVIVVGMYVFNLLKDDTSANDLRGDLNQVGNDVAQGTQDLVNGTGEIISDVADGVNNTVGSIIDYTMTDNATVENNTKTNTSEKIKADKKYQDLTFKEVTLIGRDNVTTFTAKIKNNAMEDFKSKDVTITFFKNDGTTITTRSINIPDIKSMDTTEVTVNMEEDVANAYDYTVE